MVELLGIEFGRAALTEIRVGRARDRLVLLRALHDYVALELLSPQEHELVSPCLKTFKFRHRLQNPVAQVIIEVSKPIFKTYGVKTGKTGEFT